MSEHDYSATLGEWQGYRVRMVGPWYGKDGQEELWVELVPDPEACPVCDGCGERVQRVHDTVERLVRDLPVFERPVRLLVHRRRVQCPWCGPCLERIPWLERYARVTKRLALNVARLCGAMSLKAVAAYCGLGWDAVKALHRRYLEQTLETPDFSHVDTVIVDEFSLSKGHRYATVIVEPTRRQVLWVEKGRGREALRPFLEALGAEGRERLKAVGMDMNGAYEEEVRAQCPNAEVVFDLFHVVQKYHKEVLRRVRNQEAKRAQAEREDVTVYKGSAWLLLSNRSNLDEAAQARLDQLLQLNERLFTVHVLRDDLKQLWIYRDPEAAERFFEGWCGRAQDSGIPVLQDFARRLRGHWPGLRAHSLFPIHTSLLEGINNTIKVIKRTAYGWTSDTTFATNSGNELTSSTFGGVTTTYGYDAWGNMTSKARGSYTAYSAPVLALWALCGKSRTRRLKPSMA